MERLRAKSNHHSCLNRAPSLGRRALFRNTSKKIGILSKNHIMTSTPPPPSSPGLKVPERKENVDSQKYYSKKYTHFVQEWEIHIPDPSVKSLMFGSWPFCLTLVRCHGVHRDLKVYSLGVRGAFGKLGCLLCKEPPPESLSETKRSLCDRSVEASQSL